MDGFQVIGISEIPGGLHFQGLLLFFFLREGNTVDGWKKIQQQPRGVYINKTL